MTLPSPSSRAAALRPSAIRALSEGAPPDCISLGLGEPSWELHPVAREALARTSRSCGYGPNAGLPELREVLAARHQAQTGEVLVGCGSQGVLFALFQAWLGPGDQVLLPDPGFLAYPMLAGLAGAEVVPYSLGETFQLDADPFLEALARSPRARMAVLNHPANPTGAGANLEALARIAEACEARGLLLLSDEVYRELYLEAPGPSLREVWKGGLVLSSCSKAWGAPGLRVGWAVGPEPWLAPARQVHACMVSTPARPAQEAACALLEASDTVLPTSRRELRLRWESLVGGLERYFGERPLPPSGGFYHWMPLPEPAREDPMAFCLRLRDEGRVVVVPGLAFGDRGRNHLRLSFGGHPAQIETGLCRVAPFWGIGS